MLLIDKSKFDLQCAIVCLPAYKVLKAAKVSTCVLPRIKQGKAVRAVTVGKIAKALQVEPQAILAE